MNFQPLIDTLNRVVTDIINFIPNLINGLIVLIIGYLVAVLVRWIVRTVLQRVHFDPLVEKTGITGSLRGLGIKTPLSIIVAQTIFFMLLITFLIGSTRLMGLEAVARLLERLMEFLPNVIAAVVVFLLGGIVANLASEVITTVATGAGIAYATRLGKIAQYIISAFVVVIALGVLGVDTGLLVTAITIGLASFGLALGLALGLGAKSIVHHILSGYYLRQRVPPGRTISFGDTRGEVKSVGSVNTVLSTAETDLIVPNGALIDSVVETSRPQTT